VVPVPHQPGEDDSEANGQPVLAQDLYYLVCYHGALCLIGEAFLVEKARPAAWEGVEETVA
jgi:hypothetical protein